MRDVDAMVFKAEWPTAGYSIARKRGIPGFEVDFLPLEPDARVPRHHGGTQHVQRTALESYHLRSKLPALLADAHALGESLSPVPRHAPTGRFWALSGICPRASTGLLRLQPHAVSQARRLAARRHVVGYFFLDEPPGWQPPAELCRFLDSGSKPICVGFGSMPSRNPTETALAIVEGLRRSGQRAIFQRGWGKLSDGLKERPDVFLADDLPHSWLFPRTAAVIHHGGSGTVGAVLRAGVPSIVIPHNFDQPYWARRASVGGVAAADPRARSYTRCPRRGRPHCGNGPGRTTTGGRSR